MGSVRARERCSLKSVRLHVVGNIILKNQDQTLSGKIWYFLREEISASVEAILTEKRSKYQVLPNTKSRACKIQLDTRLDLKQGMRGHVLFYHYSFQISSTTKRLRRFQVPESTTKTSKLSQGRVSHQNLEPPLWVRVESDLSHIVSEQKKKNKNRSTRQTCTKSLKRPGRKAVR